jgi:hypothetical protein
VGRARHGIAGPLTGVSLAGLVLALAAQAQPPGFGGRGGGAPGGAPPSARDAAPVDLTGTWVSLVTEDWIERMSPDSPPSGSGAGSFGFGGGGDDGPQLPQSDDPCAAYGAGGIMRMPGRVRISWQDDQTLLMEFDAGSQRRITRFSPDPVLDATTIGLQGSSRGEWQGGGGGGRGRGRGGPDTGFGAPTDGSAGQAQTRWGSLKIETTNLSAGYLLTSRNWYGDRAMLTELIRPHSGFGDDYFTVTAIIEENGAITSMSSSTFKRESNDSDFSPTSCQIQP